MGLKTPRTERVADLVRLTILHTNDMHGRLEAMARLASFARKRRAQAEAEGRRVFLWDAGDATAGQIPISSMTRGAAFSPILNAMGYSLKTIGNTITTTYGPQGISATASRASFPILAANLLDGGGRPPGGLQEFVLISITDRLRMGVIGLTCPFNGLYAPFILRCPDFRQVACDLVQKLREQGAGPILVLSHLGLADDRRLADEVRGIDVIIGAHSHDRLPSGEERNGVLIVQAGEYAESLGRVDLTLDPETGQVLERAAWVLDVPEDEPPDSLVMIAVALAEQEAETLMAQPVGVLVSPLEIHYERECGMGSVAADALCEWFGAEAAMLSSGVLQSGLSAGGVTLGQLDAVCLSSASPFLTEVRGEQLLAALERGLDPAITRDRRLETGRLPPGIPQISGLVVEYDPAAAVGGRVRRVTVQGEALDPGRIYRVAHTGTEIHPEVGYLVVEEGRRTVHEGSAMLRQVLEAYLRRHSPVSAPRLGRWLCVGDEGEALGATG
jgi:5'-nucleotidase